MAVVAGRFRGVTAKRPQSQTFSTVIPGSEGARSTMEFFYPYSIIFPINWGAKELRGFFQDSILMHTRWCPRSLAFSWSISPMSLWFLLVIYRASSWDYNPFITGGGTTLYGIDQYTRWCPPQLLVYKGLNPMNTIVISTRNHRIHLKLQSNLAKYGAPPSMGISQRTMEWSCGGFHQGGHPQIPKFLLVYFREKPMENGW